MCIFIKIMVPGPICGIQIILNYRTLNVQFHQNYGTRSYMWYSNYYVLLHCGTKLLI